VTTVGLVVHGERAQAAELAREIAAWLLERGQRVVLPEEDAARAGLEGGVDEARLGAEADVVLSLGGDGTMLRTVDLVAAYDVPVLGINVGQLGYLTEVDPADWEQALTRWLNGEAAVEERMMLSVRVERAGGGDGPAPSMALNEAVLEKTPMGHTVRMRVHLDGAFFTTYAADGLIVATPTGSTAYSLSARGPIVAPEHRAILLTPVSPHMLFDRTLVLEPGTVVGLEVCGPRPATLSVDGRNQGELVEGDVLVCTAADHTARLVTFGGRDFHQIVKAKFGLEDR
jgi:NAD+ kinase